MVIHTWVFSGHCLKTEQSQNLASRKTDDYLLPMIKFEISSKIYNFGKLVSATRSLKASHKTDFSNGMGRVVHLFFTCYNDFCQHLEGLHNSEPIFCK